MQQTVELAPEVGLHGTHKRKHGRDQAGSGQLPARGQHLYLHFADARTQLVTSQRQVSIKLLRSAPGYKSIKCRFT